MYHFIKRDDKLFTDFVFADFLVTYTPYVSKVVFQYAFRLAEMTTMLTCFHSPKLIPWFVSDVTPPDFASSIPTLLSSAEGNLKEMVERWQSYISSGVFSLSVPQDVPLGYSDPKV